MQRIIKENIVKNIILIPLLITFYFLIRDFLVAGGLHLDKTSAANLLLTTSIIAVIACFGNYAFTYEKINPDKLIQKIIGHGTTFLLMLVIGISLIFTSILTEFIMGKFWIWDLSLIILYLSSVGFDFWDLSRIKN